MCSDMELGAVHRAETLLMKIFVVLDVNFLLQHCLVSRMSWCSFFPCIPWPAAMNKLKLTWVISDNKVSFTLLLVSCFRGGFISEFAPDMTDLFLSGAIYISLVWRNSLLHFSSECVLSHGGAVPVCPLHLFCLVPGSQQLPSFGNGDGRWGKGQQKNGKTSSLKS